MDRYPPINPKCPHMLHGGDYNPDQWPADVWAEDMRLMRLAHCNAMSVGIFAWAKLEPAEGEYDFAWLDRVMDLLAQNGAYAVLATPSGARPAWMAAKYPEVLRVRPDRGRNLFGRRHNHCLTSPVYREKVRAINRKLAERYRDHPALLVWHISNEYGGECHCALCRGAFREWLRSKYADLDALNAAWWTAFWSHTYTDWSQIEPPSPIGEVSVHGLNLDWKRFVTDQTTDFMMNEIGALREFTPDVPVTTNMMGTYRGLNYWRLAPHLDVISWDSYPTWHSGDDVALAASVAFLHDLNRSLKGGKPFMLMESVPSATNWMPRAKRKRPGMHALSSLQAVAHGSDTVQYFQWRKSRGSAEKFHGAVVDHVGHEHTRVFRDVADLGCKLERLDAVVGTTVRADVAIIYDWENVWAMDDAQGPRRGDKGCLADCKAHYRAFWRRGVPVDVIDMEQQLSPYKLVVAPMLYMVRPGVVERIEAFVAQGGTLVTTYWSGIVDENDLTFLGGFPGPLRRVLGIWAEEIDALYDGDRNFVVPLPGNALGLSGEYVARELCDLIHAETATVLATYGDDFYAGRPALTVNHIGEGRAYYLASRNDQAFLDEFYGVLIDETGVRRALIGALPEGVSAQVRTDGERSFVFAMNIRDAPVEVDLGQAPRLDLLTGRELRGPVTLAAYEVLVLAAPPLAGPGAER
jgi:beta-galactosidase